MLLCDCRLDASAPRPQLHATPTFPFPPPSPQGDVALCHPFLLHRGALNTSTERPRILGVSHCPLVRPLRVGPGTGTRRGAGGSVWSRAGLSWPGSRGASKAKVKGDALRESAASGGSGNGLGLGLGLGLGIGRRRRSDQHQGSKAAEEGVGEGEGEGEGDGAAHPQRTEGEEAELSPVEESVARALAAPSWGWGSLGRARSAV